MNLSDLEKKGAFISNALVKKTSVWKRFDKGAGNVVEDQVSFFVRQASWLEFQEIGKETSSTGESLNPDALLIAACIKLGEKGEESLAYDKVITLDASLFNIFRNAVAELYAPKN